MVLTRMRKIRQYVQIWKKMQIVWTLSKLCLSQCCSVLCSADLRKIVCYLLCFISVTFVTKMIGDLNSDETRLWRLQVTALKRLQPDPIDDFIEIPCYPGLVPSTALKRQGTCVRMLGRSNFQLSATMAEACKYLKIGDKTPICSYRSVKNDTSDYFSEEGLEERVLVEDMLKILRSNKDMGVLDIGTNVGVYCIAASKVNNRTVCVDANYNQLQQIQRSLFLGNIYFYSFMIWNKLSNKHTTEEFVVSAIESHGETKTVSDFQTLHNQQTKTIRVNTITLNDLQGIFHGLPIFVKMDLGHDEEKILKASKLFFKTENIKVVQMALKHGSTRHGVIDFFKMFGFLPFADAFAQKPLFKGQVSKTWPYNVYFIKPKS